MFVDLLLDLFEQGLIFSLPVMAVFLTSKVLGFDDLTVEGSFCTGGAVMSCLLLLNIHPWLAFLACGIAGGILGSSTAFMHTRLGISPLISGICVTTGVFSLNLKLAGSNIPLQGSKTMLTGAVALPILAAVTLFCLIMLGWLLKTEIGLFMKACGRNRNLLRQLGRNPDHYIWLNLALANTLTAWSGALFVQWSGFFSITGGLGTLIIALAGLILAGLISEKFGYALVLGAILYQTIFAVTVSIGIDPVWNNLIKALLIIVLMQSTKRWLPCSN